MSHLRVLVCRVDDETGSEQMTELDSFDLPAVAPEEMAPETALDKIETDILSVGQEILRHMMRRQWQEVDRLLVEQYQQSFSPSGSKD